MKYGLNIVFVFFSIISCEIYAEKEKEINWYEFFQSPDEIPSQGELVFEVKETGIGTHNYRHHTIFIVKALILESDIPKIRKGEEITGYFDRWYSILDMPEKNPFNIGDIVKIDVRGVNERTVYSKLIGIEKAQPVAGGDRPR